MPSARSRILVVSLVFFAFYLSDSANAQITTDVGIPAHTIQIPVPMGFVSATTGKLHLEIALRSTPQRNGDPIVEKWIYDRAIGGWISHIGNSHSGTGSFQSSSQDCTSAGYPGYPNGSVNTNFGWYFQDDHYTSHAVVNQYVSTKQVNCFTNSSPPVYFGSGSDITSTSGVAADGSGYSFSVSNYTQMHVYAPDGTLVYDNSGDQQTAEYPVDTNGNFAAYASSTSNSGSQPDTSASGFVYGSGCGTYPCTRTRSFNDSSGTLRSYSLTFAQFQTAILNNGVQTTHTGTFVTSISVQDGNQYSFTYDTGSVGNHNGAMLTMALPTGGVVSFTYVPHVGSVFDWDWVNSITYSGGTWNLAYSQNTSNYQLTTTLTMPPRYDFASRTNLSDKTVFMTVPHGDLYPFLQTAQFYSGSSTLLKTITVGYDSNGNYVPLTVATTLNDTGQSSTASYQYFNSNLMRDYPTQVQETDFTGTIVRTTKTAYNGFMKPTSVNVYAGTGTGSPIASTLYTYDEYSANYCKNNVPMLSGFTGAHGHDDIYGTGWTSRGNVTTVRRLISGTTYSTTHSCYDTLGNVTQTVDAKGNPTSFDYTDNWNDSNCIPSGTITHAFPTTVTSALGYRSKTSYYSCGILKQSVKDENDIRASRAGATFTYDLFNRVLTATDSAGGSTTNSYSVSVPPSVTTSKAITSSVSLNSTALQDTYGRAYQTLLTSDPAGTTYSAKTFDALGHASQIYNPTRCSPPTTNCGESSWGYSTTTYDALGRTTSVTAPDGQVTTTTYSGPCSTTTDPAGKARKVCSDALGRLTQAFEDPAALNYETDYTYDLLNNLLTVKQKGGSTNSANWRTRTFTYDSLSRLLTAANPESGTINYAYDANGNLTSKTSPAPNQTGTATVATTYTYDALDRVTQKSYSDGTTPTASYAYDQSAPWGWNLSNYIGRLTNASTNGATPTGNLFNYDPMGRVLIREQCQPQNCSAAPSLYAAYTYNLVGSPTSLQFGEGGVWSETISYAYDAAGRPKTVTSSLVDSQHPATLYTVDPSIGYFPNGALRKATLANGLTQSAMYNNRLQPCRMEINSTAAYFAHCTDAVPSGNVLDFAYGYGSSNNGNVATWSSVGNQTFTRSYGYDSLNRISTMSDTAASQTCKGLSWTIDAWGNRSDQTVTSGTCNTFHAIVGTNNRLGSPYQHDAPGNMTYDGTHSYTYDAENRLTKVDGGSTATYVYDAEGHRVLNTSGGVNSFIYGIDGNVVADVSGTGNWNTGYVYLGSSLIAQYSGSTTYSIFRDHLGSTRLMTRLDKSVYDSLDFLPFGEQLAGDTGTTHKFTGKERDTESGLDNFGARFDSSNLGRFMSPDPDGAGSLEQDPQSWNMYAYARNNPLRYTDPDGRSYDVCVDNGNGGQNCVHYKNDADFEFDAAKSGATLQDGNILVNGQKVGTYKHIVDAGTENGGLSEDNILAPALVGGFIGGIRAGIRGLGEAIFGGGVKTVVEETTAAAVEQVVSGGTKQAVREAVESSTLSDGAKAAVKSALRRGAAGDKWTVEKLADGTIKVTREVAGGAGGKAGATYEQVIDGATGITKSVIQKGTNTAGELIHVDRKL